VRAGGGVGAGAGVHCWVGACCVGVWVVLFRFFLLDFFFLVECFLWVVFFFVECFLAACFL
jgi:hypothetical protein